MKFLHTSDWHLGKVFHEKPLIEDQKFVLDQIISVMKAAADAGEPYAALIISGDIYDRAVPPTEAVTLLDDFLITLTREVPGTHVFLNAGNHDGAGRLSFAARFLQEHNIHLATDTHNFTTPVVISQGDERCAFYQLPFLTPLSVKRAAAAQAAAAAQNAAAQAAAPAQDTAATQAATPAASAEKTLLRTQQALYEEAVAQITAAHEAAYAELPAVLNAHLFASGSTTGASERSNVGTAEQVGSDIFAPFAYGAFGHIHRCQSVDKAKRCWYSGALLAYNFDDAPETGMNEVTIDCAPPDAAEKASSASKKAYPVTVTRIPFKALHPVVKITAEMKSLTGSSADSALIQANREKYVQVILTDAVMPLEAFAQLKTVFPHLLSVVMSPQSAPGRSSSIEARKAVIDSNDPERIISQFMKDIFGEADDELIRAEKALFVEEAAK